MTKAILVQAVLCDIEAAALRSAARHIEGCAPITFNPRFLKSLDDVENVPSLVITSLLHEIDTISQQWPAVEARLRSVYATLSSCPGLTVFICTVLRDAGSDDGAAERRRRIRRLNLLAAEISRDTGVNVIDLDRSLADIGARPLATDYRLGGPYALEAAAKTIALTLLLCGLDDYASYEAQEDARAVIAAYRPPMAAQPELVPISHVNLTRVGAGRRRRQRAAATTFTTSPRERVEELLHGVFAGQLSPVVAIAAMWRAAQRYGIRASFVEGLSGLVQYLRSPPRRAG
jgi:hypothetical protein